MIKEEVRYGRDCVFEGMTSISAVINSKNSDRKIIKVLYDAEREQKLSRALAYLKHRSEELGFEIVKADAKEIDKVAVGSSHGGIVAYCTDRSINAVTASDIAEGGFYVYIEGVEDPYNFGYCLRSVYAAGADGVILPPRNWMTAAGVVCRSSAGASELMPLYTSEGGLFRLFREKSYKILCADTENARSVYDTDCAKPVLLVVGGEKRGITRELLRSADVVVSIDYGRDFDGALSAASASAVLSFEIMRQNRRKKP